MNLAYYRKSNFSKEETINKIKELSTKNGLSVLSEISLSNANAVLLQVCNNEWVEGLIKNDKNLIGLMPCSILIVENGKDITVGSGNATILAGVTPNREITDIAIKADKVIKDIIHQSTGTEALKPTKVKLYSTTTCPYCVMEKEWLESNKVEHEVVYVDKSQEEAQKMVQETGQMGVPVTEIQYGDDEKEFIVGFDKQKLSSILSI